MAKSTKSYEERMLEMEKKEQESLEKANICCENMFEYYGKPH